MQSSDNIFDVLLAVFGHVDHFVQKGIDAILIFFQDIGNINHVIVLIEKWIVEDEPEGISKLLAASALLYARWFKRYSKRSTNMLSQISLSS